MTSAGGKDRFDRGSSGFHAGDDVQRGSIAGFQDGHEGGALAVDAHDVGLRRKAVAHVGDVVNVDGGGPHGFDGKVIQFWHGLRRTVHIHFIFERADFRGAGRKNQVLEINGGHDVIRR